MFSPVLGLRRASFYFSLFCSKRNVNSWGSYFVLSSKSHSLLIRTWCATVPFVFVAFVNWKWKAVKFRSGSGMIKLWGALDDKCDLVIDDRASEEPGIRLTVKYLAQAKSCQQKVKTESVVQWTWKWCEKCNTCYSESSTESGFSM